MASYQKVLEPVARALDTLQGEINNSQGFIVPVLSSLKVRISLIEANNNIIRDFKTHMMSLVNGDRLSKYFQFNTTNKDFLLAAATLPRFKLNFIVDDESKIIVKNLLITECKKIFEEEEVSQPVLPEVSVNQVLDDDFLISYSNPNANRRNFIDHSIESEVAQYLADNRLNTGILDEYRFIRKAYYKFNTTLPSSAPVERVFSQSTISDANFEKTLFLKHNRMILEQS